MSRLYQTLIYLFLSPLFFLGAQFQNERDKRIFPDTNLVFVQSGKFHMGEKSGETDEKPLRKLTIKNFYIGKYEVSNAEYAVFLNEKGNQFENHAFWIDLDGKWNDQKCRIYMEGSQFYVEKGYDDFPVNFVNWYGARAYCNWKGGRLPTEAEWEYAAKGGKKSKIKDTRDLEKNLRLYAWFAENSKDCVRVVGLLKPNKLGIYDISGNLWEWCNDYYDASYYNEQIKNNPTGPEKGDYRVIRGGSWTNKRDMLRISNRNALNPNSNKINIGFRIVFDY